MIMRIIKIDDNVYMLYNKCVFQNERHRLLEIHNDSCQDNYFLYQVWIKYERLWWKCFLFTSLTTPWKCPNAPRLSSNIRLSKEKWGSN